MSWDFESKSSRLNSRLAGSYESNIFHKEVGNRYGLEADFAVHRIERHLGRLAITNRPQQDFSRVWSIRRVIQLRGYADGVKMNRSDTR